MKKAYLAIPLLAIYSPIFTQSITPLNPPFMQGQPLQFVYTGGTGSPLDWVGIYQAGQVPGNVPSTVWQYVPSANGQVTFAGTLPPGTYDIHLFCCDGYNIIASHTHFTITGQLLKSRLTFYKQTDTLTMLTYMATPGDLVRLYHASDFSNGTILANAVPLAELPVAAGQNAYKFPPLPFTGEFVGVALSGGQVVGHDGFEVKPVPPVPGTVTRIGTGSCGNQGAAQPTLLHALQQGIDLFLYTGDNLYIDTYNANVMRASYENFITNRTEYQQVRATVPVLATWDDHDYGCCDEDADYPIKAQAQQIFLDFFEEPANSPRRTQQGIHTSYTFGNEGERLQVILLDTRYFLDDKRPNQGCGINDYCPWDSPADTVRTMLGTAQWAWLKTQLEQPADLRLVATSVQFSSSYHGFEQWRLFPHQRKRMQALIKETGAEHLFFVSGDMHYAEVSRLHDNPSLYPLYDFTASAINQSWPPEGNQNRVPGMVYGDPNIGLISIDWPGKTVTFTCLDAQNTVRFEYTVPFGEMEFPNTPTVEPTTPKSLTFKQVPAPGHGMARLVFEEKLIGELVIFDTWGQAVRSMVLNNVSEVEILQLPAGTYLAEVRSGKTSASSMLTVQ